MANLTLAQTRARIQALIPDAAISNANVNSAIQTAHEVFPMEYLLDYSDENAITLATNTWEYVLPQDNDLVSIFVLIHNIWMESSTAGVFDSVIPQHLWRPTWDGASAWGLVFSRQFTPIDGRQLLIEGQMRYVTPSADGDIITLHNGWVIQYACGLLHAREGGSDSSMAAWHQRMAGFHMTEAQKIEDNMNNRARPDSVQVPGVI